MHTYNTFCAFSNGILKGIIGLAMFAVSIRRNPRGSIIDRKVQLKDWSIVKKFNFHLSTTSLWSAGGGVCTI